MVKFGKNKFKALNKIAKNQKLAATSPVVSNKILKKKINADKKVSFQKEILIKESVSDKSLLKSVSAKEVTLNELSKKAQKKPKNIPVEEKERATKQKPVEKHKKRQKTQINDTKLLLSLMKKK